MSVPAVLKSSSTRLTFSPPLVDPAHPPTNISSTNITRVYDGHVIVSTVANAAVDMRLTEFVNAWRSASRTPEYIFVMPSVMETVETRRMPR